MSTIHAANLALIDAEQRLLRAGQHNEDLKRQVRETCAILRSGLDQLEALICNSLDAQSRDIAAAIGTSKPAAGKKESKAEEQSKTTEVLTVPLDVEPLKTKKAA